MDEGEEVPEIFAEQAFDLIDRTSGPVARFLYYGLFSITPEVPKTIWMQVTSQSPFRVMGLSFILSGTVLIALLVALCAISGTLVPDTDPARLQLLEDRWNIWLYLLIVPGYLSAGFVILGYGSGYWHRNDHLHANQVEIKSLRKLRIFLSLAIVLGVAAFVTANYQYDALVNQPFKEGIGNIQYWFVSVDHGQGYLNRAGFVYVIINFFLLVVTMFAGLSYASLAMQAVKDASNLKNRNPEFARLIPDLFRPFVHCVFFAQIIIMCYLTNIVIWSKSPLGGATQTNIHIAIAAVFVFGLAGTQLPKMYCSRKLAKFREMCFRANKDDQACTIVPAVSPFVEWATTTFYAVVFGVFLTMTDLDPMKYPEQFMNAVFG